MSNLCSNYVVATGDAVAIKMLTNKILDIHKIKDTKKLTEENWYLCDADTLHCDYGMSNLQYITMTELTFNICSRNAPPLNNFKALSQEIPALTLTCQFEEPGCQLYGRLVSRSSGWKRTTRTIMKRRKT
jgi:hypothetical protein